MNLLKFNPVFCTKIWGGSEIASFKSIATDQSNIGESWEISVIPGSESVVANGPDRGMPLSQLCLKYGSALLGHKVVDHCGYTFPLLVKFIDANADLSIQVHPDDALAHKRNLPSGKTEMWYVINNRPEAGLYSGLSQELTPEQFIRSVGDLTFTQYLQWHTVHPGDAFFIPAGCIHAIGKGCLVAEIQQSADVTYRIYDYGRVDASTGQPRPLHQELAKEAIDYRVEAGNKVDYTVAPNERRDIVSCPYFTTAVLQVDRPMTCDLTPYDSFSIFICVKGAVSLVDAQQQTIDLHQGETCLVPASCPRVEIRPTVESVLLQTHL